MLSEASVPGSVPVGVAIFLGWTIAYVLIIRRGFKDKSFGLPMLLLCGNVSWEFWFAFVHPQTSGAQVGNILWWVLDVIILYTCLKYGRSDYTHPLTRRWFYPLVALCLPLAAAIQWTMIVGLQDDLGAATGIANAFFGSAMMIAMILRRKSVKGQSIYIALAMLIGNACGYFGVSYAIPFVKLPSIIMILYACLWGSVILGIVYVGLVYWQCRQEGINPWRRL